MNTRALTSLWVLSVWSVGCGSTSESPAVHGTGGSSGGTETGGQVNSGGNTSPGTSGKPSSSVTNSGGRSNSGGASNVGQTTSGDVSSTSGGANGGGNPSGGTAGSVQGTTAAGGTTAGGTTAGGTTAGGTTAKGGTTATGGSGTAGTAPGCGVIGSATGVQNLTIQVAGQERAYVLFVPTTYNTNTAIPLVFAWHGLGGSGTLARQYFGIEKASSNQAIFVYPTGLPNADGDAAWTLTKDGVDVQFFDALRTELSSKYCVDQTRVYSTGHSYGALMTNALGCYRGNLLRGIAPVAGMPPFGNPTCTSAVAAWIAHGDNDATVDFTTGGIASRDLWIKLDTCSATATPTNVDPSPCVAYQDCSTGHPVHWCVHQNGHNWPTFAGAGIWAFFNSLK